MKYLYLIFLCTLATMQAQAQRSHAKVYTSPRLGPGFMTYEMPLRNGDRLLNGVNVSGYYRPGDTTGISIVMRTDSLGKPLWAKRYKDPGARRQQFNDHYMEAPYEDGQGNLYLMTGHGSALAKIRPDGNLKWVRGSARSFFTEAYRLKVYPNASGTRFHFLTRTDSSNRLRYTILDSSGHVRKEQFIRYGQFIEPVGISVLSQRVHLFVKLIDNQGGIKSVVLEFDTAGILRSTKCVNRRFRMGSQSLSVAPLGRKGTLTSYYDDSASALAYFIYYKHSLDSATVIPAGYPATPSIACLFLTPVPDSSVQIFTCDGSVSHMRSDFRLDKEASFGLNLDFIAGYIGQNGSGHPRKKDRVVHTLTDAAIYPGYVGYRLGGYGVLGYMDQSYDSTSCAAFPEPPQSINQPRVTLPLVPFSGITVQTLQPRDTAWAFYQYDESLCALDYCNLPKLELATHQASTCDPTYRVAAPTRIFPGTQHYRWSTGDTTATADLPVPGRYILEVSGLCGRYRDSIELTSSPQSITIRPRPVASCPNGELAFGHSALQVGRPCAGRSGGRRWRVRETAST